MHAERFHLISAVFILLVKDNTIFLSKRANTGWGDGKYSLIGGHLDGNETAIAAAVREAYEETGVRVNPDDVEFFNVCHLRTNDERIHFSFVVHTWKGEPVNNEPAKADDAQWFPLTALPENLSDVSRETIKWYQQRTPYTEWDW